MRRAIALIFAVAACAGAPSPKTHDKSTVALLVLDTTLLENLHLPPPATSFVLVDGRVGFETSGAPTTIFVDPTGIGKSRVSTIFFVDDLEPREVPSTSLGGDAPPPPRQESIKDLQLVARVLSEATPATPQEIVRTLVVVRELQSRGEMELADEVLRKVAADPTSLRSRAREAISTVSFTRALQAYARGGKESELVDDLTHVAEFGDTNGAHAADDALKAARSIDVDRTHDGSPLDALVFKRIRDLHGATCKASEGDLDGAQWPGNDPVGRVRSLGYTAIPALYDAQRDAHLSRCLVEGEPVSLLTVGTIARETVQRITHGGETFDATDIECGHEGYDKEATDLVDAALAKHDVPTAISITTSALGSLRVSMVVKLSNVGGSDVVAFLAKEAALGPVVLARVEAARTLSASTRAWVAPMIEAMKDALAREDSPHARCDGFKVVNDGMRALLRVSAKDTLNALQTRQTTQGPFGPRALIDLVPILAMFTPVSAADAKSRDALLLSMLDDIRASTGTSMTYQGSTCKDATPSDLAALTLGKRLGVGYSCTADADAKRAYVEQIRSKLVK